MAAASTVRTSSMVKARVSRFCIFFGTVIEQRSNGFRVMRRCLTAHRPIALSEAI